MSEAYDKQCKEYEKQLVPHLTDEFLSSLVLAAKTCGWDVDHSVTVDFVNWCHDVAGKPLPKKDELTPLIDAWEERNNPSITTPNVVMGKPTLGTNPPEDSRDRG